MAYGTTIGVSLCGCGCVPEILCLLVYPPRYRVACPVCRTSADGLSTEEAISKWNILIEKGVGGNRDKA